MRVQRVLIEGVRVESWTVLGEDGVPVEPVERFLGYLSAIERSPNTVKAYAHDLKDWFAFLGGTAWTGGWSRRGRRRVGRAARLPPAARGSGAGSAVGGASLHGVEREPQARGVGLVLRVPCPARAAGRVAGHHGPAGASTGVDVLVQTVLAPRDQERLDAGRAITLRSSAARPRVLTVAEAQAILDGCKHRRDRCSRCCWTPGCGSVRRWGCGTKTRHRPATGGGHRPGQRQPGPSQGWPVPVHPGQCAADQAVRRLPA